VTSAEAPLALRWELTRKALHLVWAVIPVAYALGLRREVLLSGLGIACAVAIITEIARAHSIAFGALFHRATGSLLRQHEQRRWSGATWLLLSFLLSVVIFDPPTAIAAMWAVAVGDASAAIVGRTIGRHHIGRSRKTIEGSTACAIVSAVGAFAIAELAPPLSIAAGIAAALGEWPAGPLDDNMRIGLAVGGGILLCRMAFS
jgi:dolichol kinase